MGQVQSATGRRATVVSGHPAATAAALHVADTGGNAVDAAIAGAAVLVIALPQACGLGGDCFVLVHRAGRTFCLNGSGPSPATLPGDVSPVALARGPLSCAVPGMLGGWAALHDRFGSRPWAELLEPAIAFAGEGMPASRELALGVRDNFAQLMADPGCRTLFLPAGKAIQPGEPVTQTALAAALETIAAHGAEAFYQGPLGQQVCETVSARGGVLRADDLRAYSPLWVEPLGYSYRDTTVYVAPPNSYGLIMLLQLAALAGTELRHMEWGSSDHLGMLIAAAQAAFHAGDAWIADPREVEDRLAEALAPQRVAALHEDMASLATGFAPSARPSGTAVISVATGNGEGVTLVQSIFAPFGSAVADASTGIVLNNRLLGFSKIPGHSNAPGPRKRPAHTLNPAMVFKDNRLSLLMGTPGGTGQTITLTQVLTNVVDFGLSLAEAIAAPRWSMDIEGNLAVEEEFGDSIVSELSASSFDVSVASPAQRFFFGSAECIAMDTGGAMTAVADFRREAAAAAT